LPGLEAMTAIDMAILLDGTLPEVQAAGATAREILGRLGARPFLERLESAQRDHRPRADRRRALAGPTSQAWAAERMKSVPNPARSPTTRAALAAIGTANRRETATISLNTKTRAPAARPRKMIESSGETNE